MKVLDNTFLIDYDNGVEETRAYFEIHIDAEFVTPAPVYTEFLIGDVHGDYDTDLDVLAQNIEWVDVIEVNKRIARLAADVADEIGEQGPELTAVDTLVAATAREVGGTVVSRDSDHTHEATRAVVDVDTY